MRTTDAFKELQEYKKAMNPNSKDFLKSLYKTTEIIKVGTGEVVKVKEEKPLPKLTRSDIEKMVNLEWQNNTHILIGEVFFEITFDKYEKRFFLSINDENYSFGTLKKARDFAKEWVVDFICSALGVEE